MEEQVFWEAWGGSPEGLDQVEISEFMKLHEGVEDLDVKLISARENRTEFLI